MLCAQDVQEVEKGATCPLHLIDENHPAVPAVVNIGGADFCAVHATEAMPQWWRYFPQTEETTEDLTVYASIRLDSVLDDPNWIH